MECPHCKYNPRHNDSSGIPNKLSIGEFFVTLNNPAIRDNEARPLFACPKCGVVFISIYK